MEHKLQELLAVATNKTAAGDLKWRAFSEESFRVPIGSGYLHISRGTTRVEDDGDSYPAQTYSARVTDEQGRVVAEADATQGFEGETLALLAGLFEVARKSALKSEGVLDKMLEALQRS